MDSKDVRTSSTRSPELTPRVLVMGLILSVVMGAANVYIGLKVGLTVSASIPAAVMAMLVFRYLFRSVSILEANQVQTCASAGESLAAGIIFTMPALILIGYWTEFDMLTVTVIAFTGGLLGILFMIPMRRVFIVDNKDLPYPEGIACAAVLKAGVQDESSERGAGIALVVGALFGGIFKFCVDFFNVIQGKLEVAREMGGRIFYYGSDISPMLVGVGFIVRLNVAALIFIGGAIGWLIGIPILGTEGVTEATAVKGAGELWSTQVRYLGVGAMVVGGISSIFAVRHGLVQAVRELRGGAGTKAAQDAADGVDLPSKVIVGLIALCVLLILVIYQHFIGHLSLTLLSVVAMIVMAFFFTAVASYIVGIVGNTNSPVSGMTITTVLVTAGMIYLFGFTGMEGMVATLGVAAVVCCVACTSGDVCNDLKTGHLVGATPRKQQIMQILGVFVASFAMAPILNLLHENTPGGIGGEELSAPQAQLFANLAKGFFSSEEGTDLPWNLVGIGVAIGVLILIIDSWLKRSQTTFRAHLMPIAVGIYLPFAIATPILIGGLIAHFYIKRAPKDADDHKLLHRGVLFSSGLIAGEALMAVAIAGLAALQVESLDPGMGEGVAAAVTLAASAGVLLLFLKMSKPESGAS